jgi:plasmid stability protein
MATSITIRDVPEATRDELAARAARSGRSLQEFLRLELIELAERPDPADVIARARERVARTGTELPAATILGLLDDVRG